MPNKVREENGTLTETFVYERKIDYDFQLKYEDGYKQVDVFDKKTAQN
jgi:hypothetical protein